MKNGKVLVYAASSRACTRDQVETLEHAGFTVIFCRSADEVLAAFDGQPGRPRPDILVSECTLTHSDVWTTAETNHGVRTGISLYRRLRPQFRSLPIIMIAYVSGIIEELQSFEDRNMLVVDCMSRTDDLLCHVQSRL